jgi:hypothetical protein
LPYTDEYGDVVTSLVFQVAGDAPTEKRDGRRERRVLASVRLLELLGELRAKLGNGASVTKNDWQQEAESRGICKRSLFFELTTEAEARGDWFWWKGDCRIDAAAQGADGEKSHESTKSTKSANKNVDFVDNAISVESTKSTKSTPLGGVDFVDNMDSQNTEKAVRSGQSGLLKNETPPAKKTTRRKKANADAEPYGAPMAPPVD